MRLEMLVREEEWSYPYTIMKNEKNASNQKVLTVTGAPEKRIIITEKEPMKMFCTDERRTPLMITFPRR